LEVLVTKQDTVKVGFDDAVTINCRTCHKIHTKYDATDWALTKTDPVTFREGRVTAADHGKGNLCIQCHQSRVVTPAIDVTKPADSLYSITSSRFGPHYGSEGNLFDGKGFYKPVGSKSYPSTNVHGAIKDACVDCHMAGGSLPVINGHTMWMSTDTSATATQKVTACLTCHAGEVKTKFDDKEKFYSTFKTDLAKLKQIIVDKGWYDGTLESWKASTSKPIKVTHNQAAAMYTYRLLWAEKSYGIHNPKMARALLDNSIEVLSK
jgi:hypothetical protein